jgi:hypothetical protein
MIRVLLSAPLCLHIRLSSRFTCWPEIWIVPVGRCRSVLRGYFGFTGVAARCFAFTVQGHLSL